MKLGILLCDRVQPALQADFGDYPEMFCDILDRADDQLEIEFYLAIDRQLPPDINACDVYMTSGSKLGVNDQQLWIRELEDFIRALYNAGKGFVGICFGHQLIATALGGKVRKSVGGWGIGVAFSRVKTTKSWMKPALTTLDLVVSHQDQIVELPPGAEVLLSNDLCPYSMIQLGEHFLGLQGHPEFSREYSHALINSRKDQIPAQIISAGLDSLKYPVNDLPAMQWLLNFLKQAIKAS